MRLARSFRPAVVISTLVALLTLVASAASAAPRPRLQIQVDGDFFVPSGSYGGLSSGGALSDAFAAGPGASLSVSMGLTHSLYFVGRLSALRSRKTGTFSFEDVPGGSTGGTPQGAGPFESHRRLTTLPLTALLQYRHAMARDVDLYIEAGAGTTRFNDKVTLNNASGEVLNLTGYQTAPSYTVGLGGMWAFGRRLGMVVGARFDRAIVDDGDIWRKKDTPRLLTGVVGLTFPAK